MLRYRLGTIVGDDPGSGRRRGARESFSITDLDLDTHAAVFGVPGSGKSKFLQQTVNEHRRNGRGVCVIEPGDLIDDLLAGFAQEIMATGNRKLLKKIHVVELSPFQLVRHDPFRFVYPKAVHPDFQKSLYKAWQQTKVQSVAEIYQWKQGQSTDFEGMPTLQRNFINVFTAITTLVGKRRLTAADAEILVDLHHPDHDRVYGRIRPHLPREIIADFEMLHELKNPRDVRHETGSFLNRVRTAHAGLVKEMIANDGSQPVLDLYRIMQNGDFLFVKTGKSPFASTDQNLVLASLFFHDVAEIAFVTPRELRKPFTLIVDEAHKVVRAGIGDIMRMARKYRLSIVLATTDPVSLQRGDLDLAAEILNISNMVVAFRMMWPEQLKQFAEFLFAQNIDFTELMHEVERRAGPEWIPVDEWSESHSRQTNQARMNGKTLSAGTSLQQTESRGASQNGTAMFDALGRPRGSARGSSTSANHGTTNGRQESHGTQSNVTDSEGESYGITISHKMVHLEKIVRERQKTGMLESSVADQIARFAQRISSQSRRCATVRVGDGKAVQIETIEVKEPFRSPEAQARAVEWIRRELFRTHDYYFTPTLDPEDQKRRIDEFVRGGEARPERMAQNGGAAMEGNPLL